MVRQDKKKGESVESLLKKFKRKVKSEGTLQEFRRREHFEKPSVRKQRERSAAVNKTRMEHRQNELI